MSASRRCRPTQIEPDSHEERSARVRQAVRHPWHGLAPDVREVRAVIQVFRQLVRRVGPVDLEGDVPRAIRHQHWSVVFVPLVWAAACGDRECPVLQWLGRAAASGPPIIVGGIEMAGKAAVCAGWGCIARGNVELGHPISRRSVRMDTQPRVRPTKVESTFLCTSTGENPWCSDQERALHSPRISMRANHVAGM